MFESPADVALFVAAFVPTAIALFATQPATNSIYRSFAPRVALAPPGWLFGVAWGILYPAASVAFYCVARTHPRSDWVVAALVQFLLLLAWPRVYSGMLQFAAGLVVVLAALALAIYLAVTSPHLFPRIAHALLAAWLLFAAYLNAASLPYAALARAARECRRLRDEEDDRRCLESVGGRCRV